MSGKGTERVSCANARSRERETREREGRMDPNANLMQQRELAEKILRMWDAEGAVPAYEAEKLAELVLALDSWLLKGGAFPRAWCAPRDRG